MYCITYYYIHTSVCTLETYVGFYCYHNQLAYTEGSACTRCTLPKAMGSTKQWEAKNGTDSRLLFLTLRYVYHESNYHNNSLANPEVKCFTKLNVKCAILKIIRIVLLTLSIIMTFY